MTVAWPQLLHCLLVCFGGGTLVFLGISEVTGTAHRYRKAAAIAAALLLLLGAVALVVSNGGFETTIAKMNNVAKGNFKSLAIVGTIVCLFVAVAYAVVVFRADSYVEEDEEIDTGTAGKVLGIVAIICGVAVSYLLGSADVSAIARRVPWSQGMVSLAYVGNALAMGGTLFVSLMAALREPDAEGLVLRKSDTEEFRRFSLFALIATAIQAVTFFAFAAAGSFAFEALVFWGGAFVVGCVVPIACLVMTPKMKALAFAALAGSVIGGVCIRIAVAALVSGNPGLGLIEMATHHASLIG